jgi:hypothetical protein
MDEEPAVRFHEVGLDDVDLTLLGGDDVARGRLEFAVAAAAMADAKLGQPRSETAASGYGSVDLVERHLAIPTSGPETSKTAVVYARRS